MNGCGRSCSKSARSKRPLTPSSEAVLRRRIVTAIKRQYPQAWEYHPCDRFRVGVPDELLCINGRFIALEIKRHGQHPTPLQQETLKRIRQAGGIAVVLTSVEQLDALLP